MDSKAIQAWVLAVTAKLKEERAASQMTLGKMIDRLAALPSDTQVDALCHPHSYRGFYEDLAFEREDGKMAAGDLHALCVLALGETFEGYKGGDFTMDEDTPVWVASYGNTGDRIMAIRDNGVIEYAPWSVDD